MEMKNKPDNSCSCGGDMLAYLYDELPSNGRERFETHLESCNACIDELAELSEARYSVYEWKNIEFAPLETPRFVIPVEKAPARASWLDSIRAAFAWKGASVLAGGFAVLVIGVFGFAVFYNSPEAPNVANVEPLQPSVPSSPAGAVPPTEERESARVEKRGAESPEGVPVRRAERETLAVQKNPEPVRPKPARRPVAEKAESRRATTNGRLQNSPTLGQYVEDRDDSLRLSDLFYDLDSRELD